VHRTKAALRAWLPETLRKLGRERSVGRGDVLFRKDDATVGIWAVEEGQIRLSRPGLDGREIVLHIAGPGDLIAEASLFSPVYNCDATAATDARLSFYPKGALLAALRRNQEAADAFMAMLARELMDLRTRLERRNIRSAGARVQNYLALNTEADGCTVLLKGTIKDLAAELGLSHEALYRTLNRLQAAGKIARSEGKIVLRKKSDV
jgi:CRP-like cAMP-binding protein